MYRLKIIFGVVILSLRTKGCFAQIDCDGVKNINNDVCYIKHYDAHNTEDIISQIKLCKMYGIVQFQNSSFKSIPHVICGELYPVSLNISNTGLEKIKRGDLKGCCPLQILYASYNKITQLDEGSFSGARNLKEIYLSYNDITSIHRNTLKRLTVLQKIDLCHTKIDRKLYSSLLKPIGLTINWDVDKNMQTAITNKDNSNGQKTIHGIWQYKMCYFITLIGCMFSFY